MPVLVSAAHRPLARRVAARLLEEGGEVRVYAPAGAGGLRAAGAFVASGDVDDEGRLEAALTDVHTLVHVGPGFAAEPDQLVSEARVLATAAGNAGVRRIIALSMPGADPAAQDPLRRAQAEVERSVAQVPCPTVVIRVGLVDTPWLRDALATAGLDDQLLEVPVAPVRPADLVELLVAFDRARGSAREGHLLVAADGPASMRLGDYLTRVGVARAGQGSLRGRRLPPEDEQERLRAALGGPWTSAGTAALDGWDFAGLRPRAPEAT